MAALQEGLITPSSTIVDSGVFKLGDREFKNAKDAVFGALQLPRALTVSSDVFFYELGAPGQRQGPDHPGVGAPAGHRPPDGHRHPRRVRRAGAGPRVARQGLRRVRQVHQEGQGHARAPPRRCTPAAASSAPGRRATTSTSPSARATCRRRRCSSPPPTRRSPTAAAWCARTSACRSRTATGACVAADPQARAAARVDVLRGQPRGDHAGPARRRVRRRRHVDRRLQGLPVPRLRQDGHRRARAEPGPVVVRGLRPAPDAPDRRRHDDREGRLRCGDCGTRGAPDPRRSGSI